MADMFNEQAARETLVGQILDMTFGELQNILANMELDETKQNYELDPATNQVISQFYMAHPGRNEGDPHMAQHFVQSIALMSNEVITFLLRKRDDLKS